MSKTQGFVMLDSDYANAVRDDNPHDDEPNGILPELTVAQYDKLMRQPGTSYSVAEGWSIAWVGNGWQVFYNAIDAYYRLTNRDGEGKSMVWASFAGAWDWVRDLATLEVYRITVESVSGQK